jgi:hypothetical protein
MLWEPTGKIFHIGRRCVIAAVITLGAFEPATALGGNPAARSVATTAVFAPAARPGRPPISSQRTDSFDVRPGPSREGRVIDQLYEELMRKSARVLDIHE